MSSLSVVQPDAPISLAEPVVPFETNPGGYQRFNMRAYMLTARHKWSTPFPRDSALRRIDIFDFYALGRVLQPLRHWDASTTRKAVHWQVAAADEQLTEATKPDSILSESIIRAAQKLQTVLTKHFKEELATWNPTEGSVGYDAAHEIDEATATFELILKEESPLIDVLWVSPKGIYNTRKLLEQALHHLPDRLLKRIPAQAVIDFNAASRALAFEMATASAFHMWRALETLIGVYHQKLTGNTFEAAKVGRSWHKYIEALRKANADPKITSILDHIRNEYRNPVMHPNDNVSLEEAFGLFGLAMSVSTQILQAIQQS